MPRCESTDGTSLHYEVHGAVRGAGSPLVCLPGGPGRSSAYLADLAAAVNRTVVCLDNRGTGGSAGAPPVGTVEQLVEDVEALRCQLGLDRFELLGHSSAGNIVLLYAVRHPHRLRAFILVAPSMRAAGVGVPDLRAALDLRRHEPWYPAARAAADRWLSAETTAESLPHRFASAPFFYGAWDERARAHAASEERQLSVAAAESFYAAFDVDVPATHAALGALDVPGLLVIGEWDPCPTPASGRALAELMPTLRLDIQPGAGHYPWFDDPARFGATVTRFLNANGPAAEALAANAESA